MLAGGVFQNLLGPAALKRKAQALAFAPVISKTDWHLFGRQASLLNLPGRTVLPNMVLTSSLTAYLPNGSHDRAAGNSQSHG